MSNYLVDGSDLTSVADAIRTKGGTSGQLQFPGGFVDAIDAIPTGGGGLEYDLKTVNVTNNTPKVDRAFDNFIFFAQLAEEEFPAAADRARLAAYAMMFVYVDGRFLNTDGGKGVAVTTNTAGAAALKTSTSNMSSTSIGSTSITFSTATSQNMQHGTWHVLQVELPDEAEVYSCVPHTTT